MNNKTVKFTCKTCNTPVYRLGKRIHKKEQLCGNCNTPEHKTVLKGSDNQLDPQTVQAETLLVKEASPNASLDQVKAETPLNKSVKDYNKQWKEDKPETQSLEKFLEDNK